MPAPQKAWQEELVDCCVWGRIMTNKAFQVVGAFHEARSKLFVSLDKLKDEASLLGPAALGQSIAIDNCRRTVSMDQAQCGVVGGEGVGKSTLINAILGEDQEIVPTEKHHPGTVAPTYIRYGDGPLRYMVTVEGKDGRLQTFEASRHEFQKYALQKHNPNNEKLVRALDVLLDSPLLEGGLTLVDIPGGEGVSVDVKEQTKQFLNGRDHAVVGVTRARNSYGALKRILKDLPDASEAIGALIYNTGSEDLEDGGGSVRSRIEEARSGFIDSVAPDQKTLSALKKKTFVANLKLLASRRAPRNEIEAELAAEGAAALTQIAKVIEERSVTAVLRRAVRRTLKTVGEFRQAVARRKSVIDKLLEGETGAAEVRKALDDLDAAKKMALRAWDEEEASEATKMTMRAQADKVQIAFDDMGGHINNDLGVLQAAWRSFDHHDSANLQELASNIESIFTKHTLEAREIGTRLLVESVTPRIQRRHRLVAEVLKKIDLFAQTSEVQAAVSASDAYSGDRHLSIDRGDDVAAAVGLSSTLAGTAATMAATGIGVSVAWIPALAAGVTGAYAGIRHLLRGGDRGAGEKLLKEAFDTHLGKLPPAHQARDQWRAQAEIDAKAQRAALLTSLGELENILSRPGSTKDTLVQLSNDLAIALRRIEREQEAIAALSPA